MLFYSHIWDGLLKLASLVGFIVLAVYFDLDQRFHPVPRVIESCGDLDTRLGKWVPIRRHQEAATR